MNEGKMSINEDEEKRKQQEREDAEWEMAHFAIHPEQLIPPQTSREAGPEIAELEAMIASFESTHSLAKLHLITNLNPTIAPQHPVREPARLALIPICKKLDSLKKEINISPGKYKELKAKCRRLQRAVGMINTLEGNRVDHER